MSFISRWLLARRFRFSQYARMEQYHNEVQNMYQQMRTLRHDYRNHLQVMKAYLDMEEYGKLSEYIVHLNEELVQVGKLIETGNVMLDAVLNSKLSLARSRQIAVNVKVVLPKEFGISEYDFCILLGNLLDNAIEGCESQEKAEERFLRVYIGVFKEQLYLSVTNSHNTQIQKKEGRYYSTKASHRGLGTASVDSIAARYGGYVNRKNDEAVFATEVLLPL